MFKIKEYGARSKKWVMRNIDWGIFNQILNNISNSFKMIFEKFLIKYLKIFKKFGAFEQRGAGAELDNKTSYYVIPFEDFFILNIF